MFCPTVFKEDRPEVLRELIRAHPLGTLVTYGPQGLNANLVPFVLEGRNGGSDLLRAHLSRATDQIAELRDAAEVMVVFQGPQSYVTPSWYPTKQQHGRAVPTWNYIAVQACGRPAVVDDADWLRAQLDALTDQQERGRPEPWSVGDAPASFLAGRIKAIVGLEISIERIEGKWKASQNQPVINRLGVVAGLRETEAGSAMAAIVDGLSAE